MGGKVLKAENKFVGSAIRERRKELHLTMKELAIKAGICYSYMQGIEELGWLPSAKVIIRIADSLWVDPRRWLNIAKYEKLTCLAKKIKTQYDYTDIRNKDYAY